LNIEPKNLIISLLTSVGVTLLFIFFVFVSVLYTWIQALMLVMIAVSIFLGVMMFLWHRSYAGYPINVRIYETRAGALYVSEDRAKRISSPQQGKFAYELKQRKIKTKPIDFKYIQIGSKGQNYLHLSMPQANEYHPMMVDEKTQKLVTTHENARYWYSEQLRRNAERWSKKFGFEKYANLIQFGMTAFIIVFMLYIFLGQMSGVIASIGGISNAQAEILKQISDIIGQLPSVSPPALPPNLPPPPSPIV